MTNLSNYMQRVGFHRCIRCEYTTTPNDPLGKQVDDMKAHLNSAHPGWETDKGESILPEYSIHRNVPVKVPADIAERFKGSTWPDYPRLVNTLAERIAALTADLDHARAEIVALRETFLLSWVHDDSP